MSRYKLTIEYDGTRYSGWQMQKGGKSIQGEIIDACRELFGSESIDLFGAGRTDSGVHATGQVAHLEVQTDLSLLRIRYGINDRLPPDICILNVENADPSFPCTARCSCPKLYLPDQPPPDCIREKVCLVDQRSASI